MPKIAIAAAVNDRRVLDQCLAASPDVAAKSVPVRVYEGYSSAGAAYNQALADADVDYLVLAHQDVYLPRTSLARLETALEELDERHPEWAVAGVIGIDHDRGVCGRTWSSGLKTVVGDANALPAAIEALDELLIIIRTSAGLRFDEALPSFHLYGTDIVQIAKRAGRSAWVIDLPVIHFSRPVTNLGGGYRQAWRYMQTKWQRVLPLPNLVCPIGTSILPLLRRDFRLRFKNRGNSARAAPTGSPAEIATRLGWDGGKET